MSDQTQQNFKVKDQGAEKGAEKTPAAVKEGGVIATEPNQKIHGQAFATAHKDDKHPSGIMPAFHESFGIKGDLNAKDTGKKQKHVSDDPHPTRMMPAMTQEVEAKLKAEKRAKHEQISQSATLMAIDAKGNPAMQPVALTRAYADALPENDHRKRDLTELTRKQAAELSPEMRSHYEQKAPANSLEGWLAVAGKISQLPMDKQLQVSGLGLMAGIEQYRHEERERTWGQLIGTVQGTSEVLQGLAKIADFGAACILADKERAGKMGDEFGMALGQTIVGGVRLFEAADRYLFNIGYSGDYAKPFQDVAAVGQKLDQQWSGLPPREQERVKAKLITELIEGGAIGTAGASTIQKASKFTEILDSVAMQVHELHAASKPVIKKAVKAVSNAVDELIQPVSDTGMGVRMPISRGSLNDETKMLMSKADDLDDGRPGRPAESGMKREPITDQFPPSKRFIAELQQVLEGLSDGEKGFLKQHGIAIEPVRRITDQFPMIRTQTAGCFDPSEKTIYLAEQVLSKGQWIPNSDLPFMARHEFGHAFNAKSHSFGFWISDKPEFIKAFRKDVANLSTETLEE